MKKVSRRVAKELATLAALARMPDDKIDLTDAPEIRKGGAPWWGSFTAPLRGR